MPDNDTLTLGIDVCTGHCSVALLRGEACVAHLSEAMPRGHIERLSPMVEEALASAGVEARDLAVIGVTCGPGGFTGARLGVAFARGLALATGAQAVGITTLEALAAPHAPRRTLAALEGGRGEIFAQIFEAGNAVTQAQAVPEDELPEFLSTRAVTHVVGTAAGRVRACTGHPDEAGADNPPVDPADVARMARQKSADGEAVSPKPFYLRAPDAKRAVAVELRPA